MTRILLLLFLFPHIPSFLTLKTPLIHHCQVESYTETINLRRCLNTSISIKTTRCRGRCYSEDSLTYDWQNAPTYYQHEHHLHCCFPINSQLHESPIRCENKQFQTIKYRIITQCECKSCGDKCLE